MDFLIFTLYLATIPNTIVYLYLATINYTIKGLSYTFLRETPSVSKCLSQLTSYHVTLHALLWKHDPVENPKTLEYLWPDDTPSLPKIYEFKRSFTIHFDSNVNVNYKWVAYRLIKAQILRERENE